MSAAAFAFPDNHPYGYATGDSDANSDSHAKRDGDAFAESGPGVEYLDAIES